VADGAQAKTADVLADVHLEVRALPDRLRVANAVDQELDALHGIACDDRHDELAVHERRRLVGDADRLRARGAGQKPESRNEKESPCCDHSTLNSVPPPAVPSCTT